MINLKIGLNCLGMGYFSQRKRKERCNIFLKVCITLLGLCVVLGLIDNGSDGVCHFIDSFRLQYHLFLIVLLLLSLQFRYFLYAFAAVLILIVNFFAIKSTSNFVVNSKVDGGARVELLFEKGNPFGSSLTNLADDFDFSRMGKVVLAHDVEASYIALEHFNRSLVVVAVNLEGIDFDNKMTALKNLEKFVKMQDVQVVVFGDFGITTWSKPFRDFLDDTKLEVKNRIVLKTRKDILNPPTIGVLGYPNIGLRKIENKEDEIVFGISII